jgi:neutral trehalase
MQDTAAATAAGVEHAETAALDTNALFEEAKNVLTHNDRGEYTVPGTKLYPHQWLWDSCFIAIGMRHYDIERAKMEIYSLLRGQWANGMLPNIIFNDSGRYRADRNIWRSWLSPNSPDHVTTSGITQPPMLAEAVVRLGEKMPANERRSWYKSVWPALLAYHHWLYNERDPHAEGLTLQVHPWEVGMDNTPPWMAYLHEHQLPFWIRAIMAARLTGLVTLFRRDTQTIPIDERFDNIEVMALFDVQRRLRRKGYDIDKILNHSLFTIEDLAFNAIFIRANENLRKIARTLRVEISEDLDDRMKKTETAFEELWDEYSKQYYSRDFITHKLLKQPSVATLLPLYAGCISKERAAELVRLLEHERGFGPAFPVPSVPVESQWFKPMKYWQGPTWVNINWLIIDGLNRYGFKDYAQALKDSTIEMVANAGFAEYFDPITGEPLGADGFSWTAALTIDLLKD